jgi:hypothetical protein
MASWAAVAASRSRSSPIERVVEVVAELMDKACPGDEDRNGRGDGEQQCKSRSQRHRTTCLSLSVC